MRAEGGGRVARPARRMLYVASHTRAGVHAVERCATHAQAEEVYARLDPQSYAKRAMLYATSTREALRIVARAWGP